MSKLAERLLERYYGNAIHPYRVFEQKVAELLDGDKVLLDAGCGRTAPVLVKFRGRARRLIGVDLVEFAESHPDLTLISADLAKIPLPPASTDVIMSRSVFEHLTDPSAVYREFARLLKPGGYVVFLTGNAWDYAALLARVIPNRFHPAIVAKVEGRAREDVFPTAYRTNTRRAVARYAKETGFSIADFLYLGQYPGYFMFNGALFYLGTLYDKLVCRFEALEFLRGWILVTLRKGERPDARTRTYALAE